MQAIHPIMLKILFPAGLQTDVLPESPALSGRFVCCFAGRQNGLEKILPLRQQKTLPADRMPEIHAFGESTDQLSSLYAFAGSGSACSDAPHLFLRPLRGKSARKKTVPGYSRVQP